MKKSLARARVEHDKFLTKMGVHPSQLKEKKKMGNYYGTRRTPAKPVEEKVFLEDVSAYKNTGKVKGILANLHNEPEYVQQQVRALQSRVMPLYNKGGLQLALKNEDLSTVGARSRRG